MTRRRSLEDYARMVCLVWECMGDGGAGVGISTLAKEPVCLFRSRFALLVFMRLSYCLDIDVLRRPYTSLSC
jgi:hypothetical protein